jgi:nitrogen fixation/metabolism regulation signal transduction histidine kinase
MKKNRRSIRNAIVNPGYQMRFVMWAGIFCLLVIVFYGTLLYSSMRQYHDMMSSHSTPLFHAQLAEDYAQIWNRMTLGTLVIFSTALLVGLFLSHRIAGPMYQLKNAFDKVRDGKWDTRVVFRDNDEFRDLGNSFNQLMESLEKKHP